MRRYWLMAALPVWTAAAPLGGAKLAVTPEQSFYTREQEGALLVTVQSEGQTSGQLSVSVFCGNTSLVAKSPVSPAKRARVPFSLNLLPEGANTVTCRLYARNRALAEAETRIWKLPPKPNEVKVDYRTGGLIVDGKPCFPFGFYTLFPPTGLPDEEAHQGFTHIAPYLGGVDVLSADKKSEITGYLDRCAALGMKVHFDVGPWAGRADTQEKWALVKAIVLAYRDHPAVLAWYLSDEPDFQAVPPELLEKAYRFIKEFDPYRPITLVVGNPENAGKYAGACDIIMNDPYPIPWAPITTVGEATDKVIRSVNDAMPVWIVPQAFGSQEVWRREPMPDEERVMTYQALIHGATGIQYFIRRPPTGAPRSPGLWSACRELALEVREFTPWLLSGDERPKVRSSSRSVQAAAWLWAGQALVLAANTDNATGPLRLTIEGSRNVAEAEVLFENRTVAVKSGVIEEPIEPLGTRAYLVYMGPEFDDDLQISNGNLIWNPSFEQTTNPSTPDGWHLSPWADRGAVMMTDPQEARHGRHSLRVTVLEEGKGFTIRSMPFPVEAGASYQLTLWAKAKEPGSPFEAVLSGTDAAPQQLALTTEWQEFTLSGSAKADEKQGAVMLKAVGIGTVWFDLVQVVREGG